MPLLPVDKTQNGQKIIPKEELENKEGQTQAPVSNELPEEKQHGLGELITDSFKKTEKIEQPQETKQTAPELIKPEAKPVEPLELNKSQAKIINDLESKNTFEDAINRNNFRVTESGLGSAVNPVEKNTESNNEINQQNLK